MSRTKQLFHNGSTIFHMDFSNLNKVQEINSVINESVAFIRNQQKESLLTLTNVQGMHFSNEIKQAFNEFIKGNKPYVKAGAVIGLNGLQQIVYNGLMKMTGRDIKSFSSETEAKDWLAGKQSNN